MDRLSSTDREALTLTAWDGLSPAEVAVVVGCSPAAARVRLHRARRRFAALLRAEGLATDLARSAPTSEEALS